MVRGVVLGAVDGWLWDVRGVQMRVREAERRV